MLIWGLKEREGLSTWEELGVQPYRCLWEIIRKRKRSVLEID
jgi:hypothetical protein